MRAFLLGHRAFLQYGQDHVFARHDQKNEIRKHLDFCNGHKNQREKQNKKQVSMIQRDTQVQEQN